MLSLRPEGIARIGVIGLDFTVLVFTTAVSIVAGLKFGLAPAAKAAKLNVAETLKDGGRSSTDQRRGSRNVLIVSEVAFGFVLLVGSGLMIRTFISLLRADPGFQGDNVLTFQLSIPRAMFTPPLKADKFLRDLRTNLAALPAVQSVGIVSHLPLDASASNWYSYFWPEGTPAKEQKTIMADYRCISPGYFQSIGATLISGRDFTDLDDVAHPHVAIVDDDLAQITWPNQNPIGKKLVVEDSPGGPYWFIEDTVEVVGVLKHVQYHSLTSSVRSQIYLPFALAPRPLISFMVHSATPPESLIASVRKEVAKLYKGLPVSKAAPLSDYVRSARSDVRFITMLAIVLAGIALLLACIGIYGVTSYAVQQRTSQIGLRMALGAQPADVLKMVLRQGMAPVGLGAIVGLALSFALTPLLSSLLYGVRPSDLFTMALSLGILLVAGIAACFIPARRAMRVDPIVALHYE
jgi:putative ABC transport system permease protein